jgi:hypothetical protein
MINVEWEIREDPQAAGKGKRKKAKDAADPAGAGK